MKLVIKKQMLTITIDTEGAKELLTIVDSIINSPDLSAAAASFVVDSILSKTKQGIDVDYNSFDPYSPKYKKRGRVNLTRTGAMLGSIGYNTFGPTSAEVSFNSGEQDTIASYHNQGTSKMPQRHFFGFSDDDYGKLLGAVYFDPLDEEVPVSAPLNFNMSPAAPRPSPSMAPVGERIGANIYKFIMSDGSIVITNHPEQYQK